MRVRPADGRVAVCSEVFFSLLRSVEGNRDRMTRHSKNNTDGAVFTYHEKRAAGFGSEKMRLGSDSVRSFDCCCLSLMPCRHPMVSPDGYLFDQEYIYENLLKQKKAIKARVQEWERQEEGRKHELQEEDERRKEMQRREFSQLETGEKIPVAVDDTTNTTKVNSHGVDVTNALKNNFWLPTNTPLAEKTLLEKPDLRTKNPISNKTLRVKELIAVKFTPINRDSKKERTTEEENKYGRYMCPVCSRSLTNSVKSAVLRPTGAVICMECVDRFVRKDSKDPMTGKNLNLSRDIIRLQSGGTAYAASAGGDKEVTKYKPAMRS